VVHASVKMELTDNGRRQGNTLIIAAAAAAAWLVAGVR